MGWLGGWKERRTQSASCLQFLIHSLFCCYNELSKKKWFCHFDHLLPCLKSSMVPDLLRMKSELQTMAEKLLNDRTSSYLWILPSLQLFPGDPLPQPSRTPCRPLCHVLAFPYLFSLSHAENTISPSRRPPNIDPSRLSPTTPYSIPHSTLILQEDSWDSNAPKSLFDLLHAYLTLFKGIPLSYRFGCPAEQIKPNSFASHNPTLLLSFQRTLQWAINPVLPPLLIIVLLSISKPWGFKAKRDLGFTT